MTSKINDVSIEIKSGQKNPKTTDLAHKLFDPDFCWKFLMTLAIFGLFIYVVLHSVRGHEVVEKANIVATTKQPANIVSAIQQPTPKSDNTGKCTENTIADSYASFSFIPIKELHKTNGVELSFEDLMKAANLGYEVKQINNNSIKTSRVHYYYNIDRCRIGNSIDLTTKPYIRGPLIFAINQECNAVYYYSDRNARWLKYRSSRSITCTNHGLEYCSSGTIHKNKWTFSDKHDITALEFTFEKLSEKLGKENKILPRFGNKGSHYLLDMKSCLSEGLNKPQVFAVDENCTNTHTLHHDVITWSPQRAMKLFCPWSNGVSWCEKNALLHSTATFSFIASDKTFVKVNGVEFSFINLVSKLQGLLFNKDDIPESQIHGNTEDVSYYLNMKRCDNGGVLESPNFRGPLIFAVSGNCSKVHYYSTPSRMWTTYKTASKIACN